MQIINVWAQLTNCLLGTNKYGGDVAEIYLTSLMQHSAFVAHNPQGSFARDDFRAANRALYDICMLFAERHNAKVEFEDGTPLRELKAPIPYTHRVHIRVRQKNK